MAHDLTIDQLRYTKNQFVASNPTPLNGQLCVETDTGTCKEGNGTTAYLGLPPVQLSGEQRRSADDVWAARNEPARVDTAKIFKAIITQDGSDSAPTMVVLRNTLGVELTWAYVSPGVYTLNGTGAFSGTISLPAPSAFFNAGDVPTSLTYVKNSGDHINVFAYSFPDQTPIELSVSSMPLTIEAY